MGCSTCNKRINNKPLNAPLQVRDVDAICTECAVSSVQRRILTVGNLTVEVGWKGTEVPSLEGEDGEYTLIEQYNTIITGFNLEGNNTTTNEDGDFFFTILSKEEINHWMVLDLYNKNNDERVDLSTHAAIQIKQNKVDDGEILLTMTGASDFASDGWRLLARAL